MGVSSALMCLGANIAMTSSQVVPIVAVAARAVYVWRRPDPAVADELVEDAPVVAVEVSPLPAIDAASVESIERELVGSSA
jgi:hypothetical protein